MSYNNLSVTSSDVNQKVSEQEFLASYYRHIDGETPLMRQARLIGEGWPRKRVYQENLVVASHRPVAVEVCDTHRQSLSLASDWALADRQVWK